MLAPNHSKVNAREAAYLALLSSQRQERYIDETLEQWNSERKPIQKDYNLAKEIACGACRMALSLDYHAQVLSGDHLTLKRKERALLQTALYQYYYMDRIPTYALAHETVQIAKKYCHSLFVKFLNSILRKLETTQINLPQDTSPNSLSLVYSYPKFYIEELINDYGTAKTIDILQAENMPPLLTARRRNLLNELPDHVSRFPNSETEMVMIESPEAIKQIAENPDYYIQNITPALLIKRLSAHISPPKHILDLCASPGGKLISIHDLFPDAELYGNDLTDEKLVKLHNNASKYGIKAHITCGPGQEYPLNRKFDLIILDVPCSNTGVLNKRPEARWRLSPTTVEELRTTQLNLLKHAEKLLEANGEIWYMTCSILKNENEELIENFCKENLFTIKTQYCQLPTPEGYDGGFACSIIKKI